MAGIVQKIGMDLVTLRGLHGASKIAVKNLANANRENLTLIAFTYPTHNVGGDFSKERYIIK